MLPLSRYLQAPSVSQKGNFTWGGQTFGANFESDGRISGTEDIQTVSCSVNGSGNTVCTITVPAPAAALVFLSSSALTETAGGASHTFPTTAETRTHNTVTVDPAVLATSNGHTGMGKRLGSTSAGSANGATETGALTRSSVGAMLVGALVGSMLVLGGTW